MLEQIPFIGWLMIALVVLIASISSISGLRMKGFEYGLCFFKSWQFALQCIAAICFYCSFMVAGLQNEIAKANPGSAVTQADALANLQWGIGLVVFMFLVSAVMNIRKSNFMFGAAYTLAQSITSLFFFLIIFGIFIRVHEKA